MIDDAWLARELVGQGLVSESQIAQAQAAEPADLSLSLVAVGAIKEADLLSFLGVHFGTRYVTSEKLSRAKVGQWVLDLLPVDLCEQFKIMPVRCNREKMVLSVVAANPSAGELIELIQRTSNARAVQAYVALADAIDAAIRKWYKGDIHAFDRIDQSLGRGYSQMLDIYDQRAIDLEAKIAADNARAAQQANVPAEEQPTPPPRESFDAADALPLISQSSIGLTPTPSIGSQPSISSQPSTAEPSISSQPSQPEITGAPVIAEPASTGGDGFTITAEQFTETISTLVSIGEMRLDWRQGHASEVARLSDEVAEALDLSAEQRTTLRWAALLHDIGKPDEPHLTALSIAKNAQHHQLAERVVLTPVKLLEDARLPPQLLAVLASIYEREDGTGIPGRRRGSEIPIEAQIIAVADSYYDLTHRPDAPASTSDALAQLEAAGTRGILSAKVIATMKHGTAGDALRDQLLGEKPRILVIDIDLESTTVLELKLVAAGYDVTVASSTSEAAREVLAGTVDLILTEVDVEPVDGFEFLARIRKDRRTRDIPLIFVTKRASAADLSRGFELGAIDYIVKPYQPELVLAKVKLGLSRAPSGEARGVRGSLTEMSLLDILQILCSGKKRGALRLHLPDGEGSVYLQDGLIIAADHGDLAGEDALFALAGAPEGSFALDPSAPLPRPSIDRPSDDLLDEVRRRSGMQLRA